MVDKHSQHSVRVRWSANGPYEVSERFTPKQPVITPFLIAVVLVAVACALWLLH